MNSTKSKIVLVGPDNYQSSLMTELLLTKLRTAAAPSPVIVDIKDLNNCTDKISLPKLESEVLFPINREQRRKAKKNRK